MYFLKRVLISSLTVVRVPRQRHPSGANSVLLAVDLIRVPRIIKLRRLHALDMKTSSSAVAARTQHENSTRGSLSAGCLH